MAAHATLAWCRSLLRLALVALAALLVAGVALLLAARWERPWESWGASVDEVSQICWAGTMFKGTVVSFPLPTAANMQAWVESCRVVFPELHDAVRRHLRYALRSGKLPLLFGEHGDRLREARKGLVSTTPQACASGQPRRGPDELPSRDAADYLKAGLCPLKERVIPAADVAAALSRAEVARFDASALLPRRMFNVSLEDLSRLHAGTAKRIPVFVGNGFAEDARFGFKGNQRCHGWLTYFATWFPVWGPLSMKARIARHVVVPWLLRYVCPHPSRNLHTLGARSRHFHREGYPWSALTDQMAKGLAFGERIRASKGKYKDDLRFASVNLQRLPNFTKDISMPELFGLEGQVETSHSLLWFGQTRGHMHPDWHDNVVIQLTGEDEIVVFPSNCSSLVWGRFEPTEILLDWVRHGVPPGEVRAPFFHVTLRAGEGLTIPSMSFHKVVSRHSGRVALNAFFEPRWRRMRWPHAPYNFFNFQSPFLAALRVAWVRSSMHLWRTRKMTAFMHTPENDFF